MSRALHTARPAFLSSLQSMRLVHLYEGLPEGATEADATFAVCSAAVLRAYRIVTQRIEAALAALDLTMARYEVLGLLNASELGRMNLLELKKITLLHPATIGHTVEKLEQAGLVRRERDDTDGRAVVNEITESGRRLATKATDALAVIGFGLHELDEPTARRMCVMLSGLHRP